MIELNLCLKKLKSQPIHLAFLSCCAKKKQPLKQIATGLTTKDTATQKLRHVYGSLWVLQFLKWRSGVPVLSVSTTPLSDETYTT